jgi:hypothetical protein
MARKTKPAQSTNRFAFVIVNKSSHDENDPSYHDPRAIRSHVTREARRRKQAGDLVRQPGLEAPTPFKTGRFRLGTRQLRSRDSSSSSPKPLPSERQVVDSHEYEASKVAWDAMSKWPVQLQPNYDLDPFNSLPITLGSRQQNLLYYCEYCHFLVQVRVRSRAANPLVLYICFTNVSKTINASSRTQWHLIHVGNS